MNNKWEILFHGSPRHSLASLSRMTWGPTHSYLLFGRIFVKFIYDELININSLCYLSRQIAELETQIWRVGILCTLWGVNQLMLVGCRTQAFGIIYRMEKERGPEWGNSSITVWVEEEKHEEESRKEGHAREDSNREESHRTDSRGDNHAANHVLECKSCKLQSSCWETRLPHHPPQSASTHAKDLRLLTTAEWRPELDVRLKLVRQFFSPWWLLL